MNNTDWLKETTASASGRIFFSEEGTQEQWDELDPLMTVVLYDAQGRKTYGERYEFGEGRIFEPQYSYKIVESIRFDGWEVFEPDVTPIPDDDTIVECELIEYDEHSYILYDAGSIDWDNVKEFRVLHDPEND